MALPKLTPSAFFFDRVVSIERDTTLIQGLPDHYPTDDSAGRDDTRGVVPGFEALRCSIQPESGSAIQNYSRRQLDVDTSIYFPRALAVRPDDTVHDSVSGAVYRLVAYGDEAEQDRVSWVLVKRMI